MSLSHAGRSDGNNKIIMLQIPIRYIIRRFDNILMERGS